MIADQAFGCRQQCVARVMDFFNRRTLATANLPRPTGSVSTAAMLLKVGLAVAVYVPKRYLSSPVLWPMRFPNTVEFTTKRSKLKQWIRDKDEFAIVHHASAPQIYGIAEVWSHCVCELWRHGEVEIFDPYADELKMDYPQLRTESLTPEKLMEIVSVRLVVFER